MAQYIEDSLPMVKYNGLNTAKTVDFSGAPSVTLPTAQSITNLALGGTLIATTDTLTGSGAIPVTSLITKVNTTGGGTDTLANGSDGQVKIIVLDVDSGTDAVITPTTKTGFTTITMNDAGDGVVLVYVTTRGWICVANNGATLA